MGGAIGGDDGGPWLVVISLAVVIDRPKDDEDGGDDGDYRPSSRRPNSSGSKRRWRRQQQMRLCLAAAAASPRRRTEWTAGGVGADRRLAEASTLEGSFRRNDRSGRGGSVGRCAIAIQSGRMNHSINSQRKRETINEGERMQRTITRT